MSAAVRGDAALPTGSLEEQIDAWRRYLARARAVDAADADELEDHLRAQVADLAASGLSEREAFLVAVGRLGAIDDVSREFAREHSERLWKQLVLWDGASSGSERPGTRRRTLVRALLLAAAAALVLKLPSLLGVPFVDGSDDDLTFYLLNAPALVLPFLGAYLALDRRMSRPDTLRLLVAPFLVLVAVANVYPFDALGSTVVLTAIHLPVALWALVGVAYAGGDWRSSGRRMDFVRFTGEWVVYYALIALGGGALTGIVVAGFAALGLDATGFVTGWLVPCGAAGAVVVAAWLVEAKQAVVENVAPVLARVFTPLATLVTLALLVATLARWDGADVDRGLLILVDVLLVLVLGLLLYVISAREPAARPGAFDRLQLGLVTVALLTDAVMLAAMVSRTAEYGASPNKVAALGLNVVLLVNLLRAGWLQLAFLRGTVRAGALERWQTAYLPVFAAWAALVVVVFGPLFGFE
ncbi:permease prefix domain 1-containing protein [Luteimicrobium sp. NPDC057192]|uniref:permease prefix domain 1-containing protein n=1 Tax=Luteimicrobium sp. NPDC057192 TaxID=3346042 RepID=UPI00363789EA